MYRVHSETARIVLVSVARRSSIRELTIPLPSTYAANTALMISKTYAAAQSAAALSCGPSYAPIIASAKISFSHSIAPTLLPSLAFFALLCTLL